MFGIPIEDRTFISMVGFFVVFVCVGFLNGNKQIVKVNKKTML